MTSDDDVVRKFPRSDDEGQGPPQAKPPSTTRSTSNFPRDDDADQPPRPFPWDPLDELGGMPSRGSWMVVFGTTLLGAVLGGLLAGVFTPPFTSVALVQGAPARLDPSFLTPDDDRYAQTEAAYADLEEAAVTAAVQERVNDATVQAADVSVVPGTTILRFTASGATAQAAADAANISAQAYVDTWRQRTSAALTESLALLDQALAVPAEGNDSLAIARAELVTQLAAVQATERVVKPATPQASRSASSVAVGAILGGLVGAALGLLWLLRRRRQLGERN